MNWAIELRKEKILFGTMVCYSIDQPWYLCYFKPTEAFTDIKPLFDALKEEEAGNDTFLEADEAIQSYGLELVTIDNNRFYDNKISVTGFLLYIDNENARFRY